jgi:hypothetical protein
VARRYLATPLVLLLLIVGIYWKLALLGPSYVWFDHYDMCQLEIPRFQFLARAIHSGHLPLWDPHVWAGLPAIGAAQPGLVYPLNLLFASLPLAGGMVPVTTLNWLFLALHFIGALFFYLLCRDQGLGAAASTVGALSFSCGGYFGSAPWLDIGNGLSWTPIVFLFAIRLWRGRRVLESAILLGVALGGCWLSGHHEVPLMNSYAVLLGSLAVAAHRVIRRRRFEVSVLAWTALALTLAATVSAIQTLPLIEFGQHAVRWVGAPEAIRWGQRVPYSVFAKYSLPPAGIAGLLVPSATPESHTTAFMGLTVAVLAAMGLAFRWRDSAFRIAVFAGAGGLVYALGAFTPIHRILYTLLPMLDKARNPIRGLYLVCFALSFMAAFGADSFLSERGRARRAAVAIVAGVTVVFLAIRLSGLGTEMYPALPSQYLLNGTIAALALAALALWIRPPAFHRGVAAAVLIALVILELGAVSRLRMTELDRSHTVCATALVEHRDLADRLWAEKDAGRIDLNREDVMTSLGDLYGFDQLASFTAGAPANVYRTELYRARTQALFGVTHYIAKTAAPGNDTPIGTFEGGLRIFRKQPALPRAWVAHDVLRVSGEGQLKKAIQNPAVDLARVAIVMGDAPALQPFDGTEAVTIARPDDNTVVLSATLLSRGLVVVSDVNYPGWVARLDGAPARIYEAYGALRAVVAPTGSHRIEMRYEPGSVRIGAIVTLAGLVTAGLLLWWRVLEDPRRPGGLPH